MSAFSHIPSSQDDSKTLIGQNGAIIGGVLFSLFVGVPLAFKAIGQVLDVIGQLVLLLVAAYLVALSLYFWVSKCYKNGLTSKELMLAVFWPVGLIRSIRLGVQAMKGQVVSLQAYQSSDDAGDKIVSQSAAFIGGIVITIISVLMFFSGIQAALSVTAGLIWLAFLVWVVGMVVQFWTAQSWRDGLTVKELTMAVLWPLDMVAIIRAGVKRRFGATA